MSAALEERTPRVIAAVGASAGGVEALTSMARGLPLDADVALLVVLHMPVGASSRLPEILSRAGPFPARTATTGTAPRRGFIHVAPPDRHLVLSGGKMVLLDGPRENGFRPAIDPLLRSAAKSLGTRAIGVILSGTMDDGAAGMAAIQALGGTTIVQEPADAMCAALPEAIMDTITPDHVVGAAAIGPLLAQLGESLELRGPRLLEAKDVDLAADPMTLDATGIDLSCPECGGALQEVQAGSLRRYRCRIGHVLSGESLLNGKGLELEAALWAAVRTLEETASVSRRLAERARASGAAAAARRFDARQLDAVQRADLVRQAIGAFDDTLNERTEEALAADQS